MKCLLLLIAIILFAIFIENHPIGDSYMEKAGHVGLNAFELLFRLIG